ncbi:MAG: DegT/DnrJ/EryC1/StrS family aminotransferase, partial [Solirubrobacteraceae bacterium]
FPSKNLGGFGDGGAITTSDPEIAERARTLRFHGSHDKVTYDLVGYNSRLDELQAAILRVQLPHLDTWATGRRAAGAHYEQSGLGELVTLPVPVAGAEPAWHLYVIAHPIPQPIEAALAAAGIGHKPYYRTPIHRQPAMRQWGAAAELPATEHAAATHLAIPMSAVLTQSQVEEVVAAVRRALS